MKISAGAAGVNNELTEFGQLLSPVKSGVIKLLWHAKDKPTRIAWIGHCKADLQYGKDGEAIAEPSIDGTLECFEQLGKIYRSVLQ